VRRCCCHRTPPVHDAACPHTQTHTHTYAIASVVYTGVVCPFRCTGGIGCGGSGSGEGQIVYLLTSLTCWCSLVNVLRVKHLLFFSSVRLLCSPLSAAIILPRRRFVVVVVYSPPSLKHRHRMRISLHRCSERQAMVAEGEDWRGRTTYYTRAARTLRGVQLQYYCLVWPVRDCPGGKRIPRVLCPSSPTSTKIPLVIMRQKYISNKKLVRLFSFDFCA